MSSESQTSEVVRVEDRHLPLLLEFIRASWDPDAELDSLREGRRRAAAKNLAEPGVAPPTFLFLHEGRAVGHVSTIPTRVWWAGDERAAYFLKGLWVLPEQRNGPIGALLVREALGQLDGVLATAVERVPRRLFAMFGMQDLGAIGDYVGLLRPERVLAQLDVEALGLADGPAWRSRAIAIARLPGVSLLAGILLRAARRLRILAAGGASGTRCTWRSVDPERIDRVWRLRRQELGAAPTRCGAYVEDRCRADSEVEMVEAEREGQVVGFALLRRPRAGLDPRLGSVRLGTLSDIHFPVDDPAAGRALLAACEARARKQGGDALLCGASHPRLVEVLKQCAYLPASARVHLLARAPSGAPDFPSELEEWWITRADGGADEGL